MENWADNTNGLVSIRRGKFSSSLICLSPPTTHSLGSHDDSPSNSSPTHHLFTEQVESVDWAHTRTVFGTDEPNRPSRSYSFLGQISHQIASTNTLPTNLKLRHWELCLDNKFPVKSSVDEHITEDGIKSFVKFKFHYIYFIPLICWASHSDLEGN